MNKRVLGLVISVFVFVTAISEARTAPILGDAFEQTYSIDPTATIRIRNTDGTISVYGAATSELKVEANKKSFSAERLKAITVNVSTKPGEVFIDTQYPPQPKWGLRDRSGTVDYFITIPWTCRVLRVELANGEILLDGLRCGLTEARLGNGRLFTNNCFTELRLNVASGGFDASWDWWENGKFSLNAEIVNGNANARVPNGAAFHLHAVSVNGKVGSDLVHLPEGKDDDTSKIDISLGGPSQAEINLKAINGNINVTGPNP